MRCIKWSAILTIIVLIMILAPASIVYANSPSVDEVKVFQSYQETDDWLVVAVYNISGGNTTTSLCDIYNYPWRVQLIHNDDSEVVGNWTIQQCGMRPIGLYLSAAQGATEVYGGNYSVKIMGLWGTSPNASKNINASDWKGEVSFGGLDSWVLNQAGIIETYDSDTYIETTAEYGDVLNIDGGYIFDTGIPYLSTYRPDIFLITLDTLALNYENSSTDMTYANNLYANWDIVVGPEVSGALTSAGWYFGIGGRLMGALLTLMGFLSLAMIEKSVAFMIILGGVMIGVFPMTTVFVLVFVLMIILVRSLFWSST
jgi:hypothetical protein